MNGVELTVVAWPTASLWAALAAAHLLGLIVQTVRQR